MLNFFKKIITEIIKIGNQFNLEKYEFEQYLIQIAARVEKDNIEWRRKQINNFINGKI